MTLDLQITGSYRSPRSAREWEMRGARFTESSSRSHSEGETSREACITGAPASDTVYKAIRFAAAVDTAERTRVKRRSFSDCSHSLTVCGAISGDRSPWCGNLFISVLDTPGAVSWKPQTGTSTAMRSGSSPATQPPEICEEDTLPPGASPSARQPSDDAGVKDRAGLQPASSSRWNQQLLTRAMIAARLLQKAASARQRVAARNEAAHRSPAVQDHQLNQASTEEERVCLRKGEALVRFFRARRPRAAHEVSAFLRQSVARARALDAVNALWKDADGVVPEAPPPDEGAAEHDLRLRAVASLPLPSVPLPTGPYSLVDLVGELAALGALAEHGSWGPGRAGFEDAAAALLAGAFPILAVLARECGRDARARLRSGLLAVRHAALDRGAQGPEAAAREALDAMHSRLRAGALRPRRAASPEEPWPTPPGRGGWPPGRTARSGLADLEALVAPLLAREEKTAQRDARVLLLAELQRCAARAVQLARRHTIDEVVAVARHVPLSSENTTRGPLLARIERAADIGADALEAALHALLPSWERVIGGAKDSTLHGHGNDCDEELEVPARVLGGQAWAAGHVGAWREDLAAMRPAIVAANLAPEPDGVGSSLVAVASALRTPWQREQHVWMPRVERSAAPRVLVFAHAARTEERREARFAAAARRSARSCQGFLRTRAIANLPPSAVAAAPGAPGEASLPGMAAVQPLAPPPAPEFSLGGAEHLAALADLRASVLGAAFAAADRAPLPLRLRGRGLEDHADELLRQPQRDPTSLLPPLPERSAGVSAGQWLERSESVARGLTASIAERRADRARRREPGKSERERWREQRRQRAEELARRDVVRGTSAGRRPRRCGPAADAAALDSLIVARAAEVLEAALGAACPQPFPPATKPGESPRWARNGRVPSSLSLERASPSPLQSASPSPPSSFAPASPASPAFPAAHSAAASTAASSGAATPSWLGARAAAMVDSAVADALAQLFGAPVGPHLPATAERYGYESSRGATPRSSGAATPRWLSERTESLVDEAVATVLSRLFATSPGAVSGSPSRATTPLSA
jgi:hypothetical protein